MGIGTSALEQGRLAFQNNHPMSSCDFPVGSSVREEWMNGWNEARNASPAAAGGQKDDPHPGMMGDGTQEQSLDQKGNPAARINEADVKTAFGNR